MTESDYTRARLAYAYGRSVDKLRRDMKFVEVTAAARKLTGKGEEVPVDAGASGMVDALNRLEPFITNGIRALSIDDYARRRIQSAMRVTSAHIPSFVAHALAVDEVSVQEIYDELVAHINQASTPAFGDDRLQKLLLGDKVVAIACSVSTHGTFIGNESGKDSRLAWLDPDNFRIIAVAVLLGINYYLYLETIALGNVGFCAEIKPPPKFSEAISDENTAYGIWDWLLYMAGKGAQKGLGAAATSAVMANPDSDAANNAAVALDFAGDAIGHYLQQPDTCVGIHADMNWVWWSGSHAAMVHLIRNAGEFTAFGTLSFLIWYAFFAVPPTATQASESDVAERVSEISEEEKADLERRRREGKQEKTDARLNTLSCAVCGETAHYRCGACKSEYYCSAECQGASWTGGHIATCMPLTRLGTGL